VKGEMASFREMLLVIKEEMEQIQASMRSLNDTSPVLKEQ
jgi:hypothetical protein